MFEEEIVYLIINEDQDVTNDLMAISSIMGYDLRPKSVVKIRDTYFDTKKRLLQEQKINLRIRQVGKTLLLTMKSNPKRLSKRGIRRREVEIQWSYDSLARIAQHLKIQPPSLARSSFSRLTPSRVLAKMGLLAIQRRLTKRVTKDIVRHDKPRSAPLAELDIDDVTFLEGTRVRVSMVEIEVKTGGSSGIVREIGETLASLYPGILKEWIHGKFVTGLVIRRLLKTGVLRKYLVDGQLRPEALPIIEYTMRKKAF